MHKHQYGNMNLVGDEVANLKIQDRINCNTGGTSIKSSSSNYHKIPFDFFKPGTPKSRPPGIKTKSIHQKKQKSKMMVLMR